MPLNPFFLQGSASEQRLVQDLINEQLRMYGIEVYYLPREIISRKTVFQEVQSSEFDDNYLITIGSLGIVILMLGAVGTHIQVKSPLKLMLPALTMLSIGLIILIHTLGLVQ